MYLIIFGKITNIRARLFGLCFSKFETLALLFSLKIGKIYVSSCSYLSVIEYSELSSMLVQISSILSLKTFSSSGSSKGGDYLICFTIDFYWLYSSSSNSSLILLESSSVCSITSPSSMLVLSIPNFLFFFIIPLNLPLTYLPS